MIETYVCFKPFVKEIDEHSAISVASLADQLQHGIGSTVAVANLIFNIPMGRTPRPGLKTKQRLGDPNCCGMSISANKHCQSRPFSKIGFYSTVKIRIFSIAGASPIIVMPQYPATCRETCCHPWSTGRRS